MVLPILAYGNKKLRQRSVDINLESFGQEKLNSLINNMFKTMYASNGIGLAAPQIGLNINLFICDCCDIDNNNKKYFKEVFINPKIIKCSVETSTFEEGCLSIPKINENIKRPTTIVIEYTNKKLKKTIKEYNGIISRVIQHEMDHLIGVLFIDYLSNIKKKLINKKLKKIINKEIQVNYKMIF